MDLVNRKNWTAICRLRDPHLILHIALCRDQKLLERQQRAYPDCFLKKPAKYPGPFPLSVIRKLRDDVAAQNKGDASEFFGATGLDGELSGFGVPVFLCADGESRYAKEPNVLLMPPEIDQAAYDKLYRKTRKGRWRDSVLFFPSVLTIVTIGGVNYYLGWVNPHGLQNYHERDFFIVPIDLIDVNT